jgi:hypothetical protein
MMTTLRRSALACFCCLALLGCRNEELPANNPAVPTGTPAPVVSTPTPSPTAPTHVTSATDDLARLTETSRVWKTPEKELSEPERVFLAVWELESKLNKGGFEQYYADSSGDLAWFCPNALETIGAPHTAELMRRANQMFGEGGPPRDRELRHGQLPKLDKAQVEVFDKTFKAHEEDLLLLLHNYVAAHRDEIK